MSPDHNSSIFDLSEPGVQSGTGPMNRRFKDPGLIRSIVRECAEARAQGKPACFLFNRVSTTKPEQGTSLDQQEHDSFRYAKDMGFHIAHNFRVQETGSKEEQRHVFNQMLDLLQSDLISVSHIIFKSADRSTRNRHHKDTLDKLRKKRGISIHYYGSGKVLTAESHYSDELMDDLENVFAVHYSRELSHKITKALEHKALIKKQLPCGRCAMGYKWDRTKKAHVFDAETESVVRTIHSAFDTGMYSLSAFVNFCNAQKLLPISGIPWEKGRIESFLKNEFYSGWFRYKGHLIQGSHPAYITKDQFDERLRRLAGRQNGAIQGRRAHLLSRFIRCSICRKSYEGEMQRGAHRSGEFTYYKHKCARGGWTKERRLSEPQVFSMLDQRVRESRFNPEFAQFMNELFEKPLQREDERKAQERTAVTAQIARLERQKSRLLDLFSLEEISKDELLDKRSEYDVQIDALQSTLAALTKSNAQVFDQITLAIETLREVPELFLRDTKQGKIELLKSMAETATFSPDGELTLNWLKPYSFLMRQEVLEAQSSGKLKMLTEVANDGFKKVSKCGADRT